MSERSFRVYFYREEGTFWAESPDAPGFTAAARSFDELEPQVVEGLRFWMGDDEASLVIFLEGRSPTPTGVHVFIGADDVGFAPTTQTEVPASSPIRELEVKVHA